MASETLFINLPLEIRLHLEKSALKNGVTMSWLIRAAIFAWRRQNRKAPALKRPAVFNKKMVRFAVYLYGDKAELLCYTRAAGTEAGSFIRFVLEQWRQGLLQVDLESVDTVKQIRRYRYFYTGGIASTMQTTAEFYSKDEYRPKNSLNNTLLMLRGMACRKYSLSY